MVKFSDTRCHQVPPSCRHIFGRNSLGPYTVVGNDVINTKAGLLGVKFAQFSQSQVFNLSGAIAIPNIPCAPFFCPSGQIWNRVCAIYLMSQSFYCEACFHRMLRFSLILETSSMQKLTFTYFSERSISQKSPST